MRRLLKIAALPLLAMLSGCNTVVLDPPGDIAMQQRDLLLESTGLMLLIIVPVMVLTVLFAWRYRHNNRAARYEPNWDHSTKLELVIWGAPLLIIICLGAMTWVGTHLLDPYRPLAREAQSKPLEVEVVALDWKWLFIYPEYGIASVNELGAPAGRPIDFHITASSVMNSFYIPALAGQIYAMPGMETRLHAVMDKPGSYQGFSANYSGAGFSGMHFAFHSLDTAAFDGWVAQVKAGGGALTRDFYRTLEQPSENVPVSHYGTVDHDLYHAILNMCVDPGKMCMGDMSAIDAKGGLGLAGVANVMPMSDDKSSRRETALGAEERSVASLCTTKGASEAADAGPWVAPPPKTVPADQLPPSHS